MHDTPADADADEGQVDEGRADSGQVDERAAGRRAVGRLADYLFDAVVLTGWTIGLALLFLATGWPRWGFYASLLVGAVAFTQLSALGRRPSERDDQRS